MLGNRKTPGSSAGEERRTAEPGRRLGKKPSKIPSVFILTGTGAKRARITQRSEQIHASQTLQMDFTPLKNLTNSVLVFYLEAQREFTSIGGGGVGNQLPNFRNRFYETKQNETAVYFSVL